MKSEAPDWPYWYARAKRIVVLNDTPEEPMMSETTSLERNPGEPPDNKADVFERLSSSK